MGTQARIFAITLVILISMQLQAGAGNPPDNSPDRASAAPLGTRPAADTSVVFVIETGSRLYPDWKEEHQVRLQEEFFIGDTAYKGVVREFMPDFLIENGKIVSMSDSLRNPAVHVFVLADTGITDSAWAFRNFPPHFSARSFFTFQLKEILGYVPKQ